VLAKDRHEAEQAVSDNWMNSEYVLDAGDFVGVGFEAASRQRERAGMGKEGFAL
jgi:hypothetical protein